MTRKRLCEFLVASCVPDGGVYRCVLEGHNVKSEKIICAPKPMWIDAEGNSNNLWVLMREPFENCNNSGIAKYSIENGYRIGDILSTDGEVACHLAIDKDDLYAANYISGSVWSSRGKLVTHEGSGTNPTRQTSPHVHSTFFSADKKYVLCCDLGIDKVFVYDRDLNLISSTDTPAGAGARHLVFSKDQKFVYVLSEMGASIHTYEWNNGRLTHLSDTSILPSDTAEGSGSAIRISQNGRFLYAADRATKSIVVLEADGESLTFVQRVDCHGKEPRDILLICNDSHLICANQFSDSCSLFKVHENGTLTYINSFNIPAPISVLGI